MPSKKKYRVELSSAQRDELEKLTRSGTIKVRKYKRARILLLADEANKDSCKTDEQIAKVVDVSAGTVLRIRQRFADEGLEAALNEKPRPGRPVVFNGKQRAEITALACSDPPEGHALHLYALPFDPKRPVICFDERPCQLIDNVLVPLPMEPGKTKWEDYHYKRNGVCTVFFAFEPLTGRRFVQVRARRTREDYAEFMQWLAAQYPEAEEIILVQLCIMWRLCDT